MDELDTHDDVPKANAPDASERSVNESSVFRYLTNAGGTGALDAYAQLTTQRDHNQKELINPDEAVACGGDVQAEHHRAKRHLNTQRRRAKRGLSSSMLNVLVRGVQHGFFPATP